MENKKQEMIYVTETKVTVNVRRHNNIVLLSLGTDDDREVFPLTWLDAARLASILNDFVKTK